MRRLVAQWLTALVLLPLQVLVLVEALPCEISLTTSSSHSPRAPGAKLNVRGQQDPGRATPCSPPGPDLWCNDGDPNVFDDADTPGASSISPIFNETASLHSEDVAHFESDDSVDEQLWAEGLQQGTIIKNWLEDYIGRKRNRLDELPRGQPHQDLERRFANFYTDFRKPNAKIEHGGPTGNEEVNRPFALSNTDVQDDGHFSMHTVYAKPRLYVPTCSIGAHIGQRALITLDMDSTYDYNIEANRLRSSELQWQAWQSEARTINGNDDQARSERKLKYWMQEAIINKQTNNMMSLAHKKFPGNVAHDDDDDDDKFEHGTWRPPERDGDESGEVWTRLLSTPNLKVVMHALADHCMDIDDPYPVEIHTFPSAACIVVILGEMPIALPVAGTVETSR